MPQLSTKELIALLDVTRLSDDDNPTEFANWLEHTVDIDALPAAFCVYPQFLAQTNAFLASHHVSLPLATVVNFPSGNDDINNVVSQVLQAIALGAAEIDAVLPYQYLQRGDVAYVESFMQQVRKACGTHCLKIIIESGELKTESLIRQAASLAIAGGADFVKTSTGKVATGVTPDAAKWILETINDSKLPVGFKASGGVKSAEQAFALVTQFENILAKQPDARSMRIGASALYLELLATR